MIENYDDLRFIREALENALTNSPSPDHLLDAIEMIDGMLPQEGGPADAEVQGNGDEEAGSTESADVAESDANDSPF